MYDFDAYEAVDDIIDEINDEYAAESVDEGAEAYQQIYDELCERVECDELTLEEAEIINDVAAEKYLSEATKMGKEGRDIARSMKRNTALVKKAYKTAKTPAEYKQVCNLCDSLTSDIDEMIKTTRETKETNADRLDFIAHQVVAPGLGIAAALGTTAKLTGAEIKLKDMAKAITAMSAVSGAGAVGVAAVNKVTHGKKGDNSGFMTYKAKILAFLRYEKRILAKMKKKAAVKAAVN